MPSSAGRDPSNHKRPYFQQKHPPVTQSKGNAIALESGRRRSAHHGFQRVPCAHGEQQLQVSVRQSTAPTSGSPESWEQHPDRELGVSQLYYLSF